MRSPSFYAAVFGIIHSTKWEILLLKRKNTGHLDGYYSLPAGHVEVGETLREAIIRELEEEVWIQAHELVLIHTQQSISKGNENAQVYFNFYFEVSAYTGAIQNMEPDKCSELLFQHFPNIDPSTTAPYVFTALSEIQSRNTYSAINW